jgi:hypothetical protein
VTVTKIQIAALRSIERNDLFPGASHAHGNTMRSLETAGLATRFGDTWRITEAGRKVLERAA